MVELIARVEHVDPPWLARVALIKEAASFNADTERKVVKLSEDLKDMLREIKIRVSHLAIQQSSAADAIFAGPKSTRIRCQGRDARETIGSHSETSGSDCRT